MARAFRSLPTALLCSWQSGTVAVEASAELSGVEIDPRTALAHWANRGDEWVRAIVRQVLASSRPLSQESLQAVYNLYLQEKSLTDRDLPKEPELEIELGEVQREASLRLAEISGVAGVNALSPGAVITLSPGLTILFGENGTGKTGYSRILKRLAGSRTAGPILPDIHVSDAPPPKAEISYQLGDVHGLLEWRGEGGASPFTRISVFDSPAVNYHVDDDLEYVYTPSVLALFSHVSAAVRAIQGLLEADLQKLKGPNQLLSRFKRGSKVYPLVETLGASTDLDDLRRHARSDLSVADRELAQLQIVVASLDSGSAANELTIAQRVASVQLEAMAFGTGAAAINEEELVEALRTRERLQQDYSRFRDGLFAAAGLPAEPDTTWESFVASGDLYQVHLQESGARDKNRCPYCRQELGEAARQLIDRYGEYLRDGSAAEIRAIEAKVGKQVAFLSNKPWTLVAAQLAQGSDTETPSAYVAAIVELASLRDRLLGALSAWLPIPTGVLAEVATQVHVLAEENATLSLRIDLLQGQLRDRASALREHKLEVAELEARIELGRSLAEVEAFVTAKKRADKLTSLSKKLPGLLRQVTDLSKQASEQLINHSFETLFLEECAALRAPQLRLEFLGRQGRAQRRKSLAGNHRPSQVLSEGEQKVLALSDFLAEARLSGITAPIVFDDPVCSLDHRRVREVANRVATLAQTEQVIVFTHDIFFATSLLAHFDKPDRCTYYQISDDGGKGQVARATGPRWDNVKSIEKRVNETIQTARGRDGEARAALVRTGYDWIRSWCEVFTELELLGGVTQRYQPNVRMTTLAKIRPERLADAIQTVTQVFEDACRYIDGHSQPLVTLAVSPQLGDLERDWSRLTDCRKRYIA